MFSTLLIHFGKWVQKYYEFDLKAGRENEDGRN